MDTIKQRRIGIALEDGRTVSVRRMRWKAAREFMLALAAHIRGSGLAGGNLTLPGLLEHFASIVGSVESLVAQLVSGTTDLTAEQIDALDLLELTDIIQAAVQLNLGPELKNSWTGIGRDIGALSAQDGGTIPMKPMEASMPSSSMPDTAPNT